MFFLESHDPELERVQSMVWGASSIASNSYRRTRPIKGFPTEIMWNVLQKARKYREWIVRTGFPVSTENIDRATQSLTDAILDFRREGGIFEPATRQPSNTLDPRNAETLDQFAKAFRQQMNQPLVYGKQWAGFGHYWDLFIQDLHQAFQRWQSER
jgi:hypothetical protein